MRWPQIVLISAMGLEMLLAVYMHGKEVKINFWSKVINAGFLIFLLVFGGYFK